jgi:hypothetical protein
MAERSLKESFNRDIENVYNFDHEWGREQARLRYNKEISESSTNQDFLRNLISDVNQDRPIYIEYDPSFAPAVNLISPSGIGFIFSGVNPRVIPNVDIINSELAGLIESTEKSSELETIKYWVLWCTNRADFYQHINRTDISNLYLKASEKLSSLIKIM